MKEKILIKIIVIFIMFLSSSETFSQGGNLDILLNSNWKFQLDRNKVGKLKKWNEYKNFRGFQEIKVPAFFENELQKDFDGWAWYFHYFEISEIKDRIAIKFEAVDDNATVWINGKLAGSHAGYSESFYFDITNLIQTGQNVITVLCEDFGGLGGIYKEVRIVSYVRDEDLFKTRFADLTARESLDWVKNGIIYEIYPRAFTSEGTFKSITPKLLQIKNLGIDILWIMPINPIGKLKRKGTLGSPYSIIDYYEINPEFGNKADFKELVDMAHQLGMKVIVDVVLNHTSWDNSLIESNPEFYTKNKEGIIISPNPDWYDVADLNYDNSELRKYMIDMLSYWVKEFDIDGYRCDVSELVPLDFWETVRKSLEKIKPIFILSEGSLPEQHLAAFDMTYSWNLYDILKDIVEGSKKPDVIFQLLKFENFSYPKNSLRMRFNENHDKERAVKRFDSDGAFITAALVTSLPGVPLIYSGQEVGDTDFASLFEKYLIPWGENYSENEFYVFYKKLFSFRKENTALINGSIEKLSFNNELFGYKRINSNNKVIVLFNFSNQRIKLDKNVLLSDLNIKNVDFNKSFYKKVSFGSERMGRPLLDDIEIEPLGFIMFKFE